MFAGLYCIFFKFAKDFRYGFYMLLFIKLGFFDIIDILLVAFIFYQVYKLVKGTVAINIFAGIFIDRFPTGSKAFFIVDRQQI